MVRDKRSTKPDPSSEPAASSDGGNNGQRTDTDSRTIRRKDQRKVERTRNTSAQINAPSARKLRPSHPDLVSKVG